MTQRILANIRNKVVGASTMKRSVFVLVLDADACQDRDCRGVALKAPLLAMSGKSTTFSDGNGWEQQKG